MVAVLMFSWYIRLMIQLVCDGYRLRKALTLAEPLGHSCEVAGPF